MSDTFGTSLGCLLSEAGINSSAVEQSLENVSVDVINSLGAQSNSKEYPFSLDTKFGKLHIKCVGSSLFCRFDAPSMARGISGVNPANGKWHLKYGGKQPYRREEEWARHLRTILNPLMVDK
jgi:hypothetical protein